MPYIITQPCEGVCDTACVDVCPVDCIYPPENFDLESDSDMEPLRDHPVYLALLDKYDVPFT